MTDRLTGSEVVEFQGQAADPPVSGLFDSRLYYNNATGNLRGSFSGSPYVNLVSEDDLGGGSGVLAWGNTDIGTSTTTRFLTAWYADVLAPTTADAAARYRVPTNGKVRNLRVRQIGGAGAGNITYTVRKNGVATAVTVTVAAATVDGSDLVNEAEFAAGDLIDIEVTKDAAIATSPNPVQLVVEFSTSITARSTTGFREGLLSQRSSVSTATVGAGRARSSNDIMDIVLMAPTVVDITVAGAGGLDTGAEAADTWYAILVIGDSTGVNSPDTLLTVTPAAPTLPAGYDSFRHIAWVRNDSGSDFLKFRYYSRDIQMYDAVRGAPFLVLLSGNATAFTNVDCSEVVPPTSAGALLEAAFETDADDDDAFLRPNGSTETVTVRSYKVGESTSVFNPPRFTTMWMPLDDSQILEYEVNQAGAELTLYVGGYVDTL